MIIDANYSMKSWESQFEGPAEPLLAWMKDPEVTDLLFNGPKEFYVEKAGVLEAKPSPFHSHELMFQFIERLTVPLGKRIDATRPYLDGRLLEGSRFHLILPPIAPDGPLISIRCWRSDRVAELPAFGGVRAISWLCQRFVQRNNILIVGGTGSGKTTLMGRLLDQVSTSERLAIVEECREVFTCHPHAIFLEAREASPEGIGRVSLGELIRNVLRMRPDRIVVGECRGAEAFDMLQAMNCGHAGSVTTLHANSAKEALRRLEGLVLMAGRGVPIQVVREWIAASVNIVVFLKRRGSKRTIGEIVEVCGLEGNVYRILPRQDLL